MISKTQNVSGYWHTVSGYWHTATVSCLVLQPQLVLGWVTVYPNMSGDNLSDETLNRRPRHCSCGGSLNFPL